MASVSYLIHKDPFVRVRYVSQRKQLVLQGTSGEYVVTSDFCSNLVHEEIAGDSNVYEPKEDNQ